MVSSCHGQESMAGGSSGPLTVELKSTSGQVWDCSRIHPRPRRQ